ncbi:MAG: AraC family transcriptional regulator [Gemmatimonadota bacterium]
MIPRSGRLADPTTFARLCRARDYIAASYQRRTALDEVARVAELSPWHFSRRFAEAFGETPHEFLTRLRIERAKRLLLEHGHSVTRICFEVGYESLGSFSSRFLSLTGQSPIAFRRAAHRLFTGCSFQWPLYYIPSCHRQMFLGTAIEP